MASYQWTGPGGFISHEENPLVSNATSVMAGNYTLTISDPICGTASASTNVVVHARPIASASSNSPVSEGDIIRLYGGPDGMASYHWTGPGGYVSAEQDPLIPDATPAMAGIYTLTVTNSNNCTDSANVLVSLASGNGQGGPPAPPLTVGLKTYPIDKMAVVAPWTTLLAPVIAGAGLLLARRRRTQS